MAIFGYSEFVPVFLEKIVRKNLEQPVWPFQIYTSLFGKNYQKKFRTAILAHSKFIPVFLGKIVRKNLEQPFSVHITLSVMDLKGMKFYISGLLQ